jgi:competence protein ComGC
MKLICQPGAERAERAFTLAEVLAALLFMAIVIPVAVEGLRIASLAGETAVRKADAARVAERLLAENLVTTNWNQAEQDGTVYEADRQYRWRLRNENWSQDAMQLLSLEVTYTVQGQDHLVRLSTLAPSN